MSEIGERLSIAIPTYRRGEILCETIERLLELPVRAAEIIIADQTLDHPAPIESRLASWSTDGAIRWIRLPSPSIPGSMNVALREARTELVLFLDDDIEPSPELVAAHDAAHRSESIVAVVGQVLQPGQSAELYSDPHGTSEIEDLEFHFNHTEGAFVKNVMAGNLSVRRSAALAIGGFDEAFTGAAYRFETDFALRLVAGGGRIWYEPAASIHHLQLSTGGLRAFGDHRHSMSPAHSFGDYYFALRHAPHFWPYALRRIRRNVFTRHLLSHPWWIAPKLIGELRGLRMAMKAFRSR